ncbi:DNA-binding NarL/FixJ family response regulator [Granulicella aggregans]|uniref:DNA-binding NarL/FixJ family response regulator n=1 Tax=Granulicella aggregans TaxID=474949 RepID=A0A7W7ZIF6_9BACT|nr:hypothetical protein [Granulicella aggregans]MBB5060473.1 DNA-binding NarL/FixJ family response regulator [Granulicella aggregans]
MAKQILIHGADPVLLETRRQILSLNGFVVETVLDGSIPADLMQTKRPDLLVVCSSLPPDSQQRDIRASNALHPKIKCLVVAPRLDTSSEMLDADAVFHAFDGPERFVIQVRHWSTREMISPKLGAVRSLVLVAYPKG